MKKKIILISIPVVLLLTMSVLFGLVFCLRNQSVSKVGDWNLIYSDEEIINAGKLQEGKSIFTIDKNKASENIEKTFNNVKVIQIKTTGLMSVEIVVRERHEMFYVKFGDKCYTLDEDLKVLNISQEMPTSLIEIRNERFGILSSTNISDFVGNANQKSVIYNLFLAYYTEVMIDGEYLSRNDILEEIKHISLEEGRTLNGKFARLVIVSKDNVTIDIGKPEHELKRKINSCYAYLSKLTQDQKLGSRIVVDYNENDEEIIKFYNS